MKISKRRIGLVVLVVVMCAALVMTACGAGDSGGSGSSGNSGQGQDSSQSSGVSGDKSGSGSSGDSGSGDQNGSADSGNSGGMTGKSNGNNSGGQTSTYAGIYYYDADKLARYDAYAAKHPKLSPGDVVWKVNAWLDRKPYEKTVQAAAPGSLTALVGKHVSLPRDYAPTDLVSIDLTKLRSEAAKALNSLKSDAARAGLTIIAQSGYRSFSRQSAIYNSYKQSDPKGVDTYSSRPGYSEHQTGLAIDVNYANVGNSDFVGTPEAKWVAANCWKYGFIVRYTKENQKITNYMPEPWHLRYIGVDNARLMHDKKIASYEEFWVKYVAHKGK